MGFGLEHQQDIEASIAQGDLRLLVRLLAVHAAREFVASCLTDQPGDAHAQTPQNSPDEL
jgi:hypothetical protein